MFLGLDVKLPAGVFTNDDGKQFSTDMHKKKNIGEGNCYFLETIV